MIPVLAIVGATASGKSSFAVKCAKALDGEIISADSMQIYKYMDIGTGKVTEEEMQGVPHHLIDALEPGDDCNAARFVELAEKEIEKVYSNGKLPILCGGSGLYIDSLLKGAGFDDDSCDSHYREYLENLALQNGNDFLHDMLKECDAESARSIHPNNVKRVVRALEFFHVTGKSITTQKEKTQNTKYKPIYAGVKKERDVLYRNIELRVDKMVSDGLFDEVERLIKKGVSFKSNSMQAIGYREIIWYFKGLCTKDEAIRLVKRNSRRYAKRQFTWFGANKDVLWIDVSKEDEVKSFFEYVKKETERKELNR